MTRTFHDVRFGVPVLRKLGTLFETVAKNHFEELTADRRAWELRETDYFEPMQVPDVFSTWTELFIKRGDTEWSYDSAEELFEEMRGDYEMTIVRVGVDDHALRVAVQGRDAKTPLVTVRLSGRTSRVSVAHPKRADMVRIMALFDEEAPNYPAHADTPEPDAPRIFIGHGGQSTDWLELQNDLQSKHGYQCEAFESGARAGHTIRDILEGALDTNSFAILIFSGEDRQDDGAIRARQNVIHETGLFQGKIGFSRAIVLREEGTEMLSNLAGIQYIQFPRGKINSAVGDILATLRREFPQ